MNNRLPVCIELFCGGGGLSLGLKMSGFKVCLGLEANPAAYFTYTENHRDTPVLWKDIKEVKKINPILTKIELKRKDIDLIAGGPPCQGFSLANTKTRNKENRKNNLVFDFLRIVEEIKPKAFLLENVVGLTSLNNSALFQNLIEKFEKINYNVNYFVLDAADYGVPQNRKRVFITGSIGSKICKPKPSNGPNAKYTYVTVNEAIIGDLPELNPSSGQRIMDYSTSPLSVYQKRIRRNCSKVYDHMITRNSEKVKRRISLIPEGKSLCDLIREENLPDDLRIICDHKSVYRRLTPSKPSVTIANFRKAMLIHPSQNRLLSLREAARLQSFPDSYRFSGLLSDMQQIIGDAVPPLLAKAVGQNIKHAVI